MLSSGTAAAAGGGSGPGGAPAAIEKATERFDQVATHTLGVGLSPIVAGWALYALVHYPHVSWYSWLISGTRS